MALTDNLISAWELNEASGNAIDAHGTNDLTETGGTIATGTGLVYSTARDFEDGDTEYFELADNTDLSTGDIDFTFEVWINAESLSGSGGFPVIAHKGWRGGDDANQEWVVYQNGSGQPLHFRVGHSTTSTGVSASTFGALSTATWYHIVVWHDATNNLIGISINTTANTASHSSGVNDGNRPFAIGASTHSQSLYWDGLIGPARFWKRVLTSDERTSLYNGGAGLAYPFTAGGTRGIPFGTRGTAFGGGRTLVGNIR